MKTYQDFIDATQDGTEESRINFVLDAINDYKSSDEYTNAYVANEYFKKNNVTIRTYEKFLYTMEGKAVPDMFSPNYKISSGFFRRFVKQEKSYLLGNGVSWENDDTEDKLGTRTKPFDTQLQKAAEYALIGGVSYGFYNFDHVDVFSTLEFVPLFDEENGALMAGIRFWQIATNKPLRATLFESDGMTEYIYNERGEDKKGRVLKEKATYTQVVRSSPAEGTEIYDGSNYIGFPIVPLYGNSERQSELIGLREQIDCYDLIKSGYANNVDEGSIIYWLVQNAGGMDDVDIRRFIDKVRTIHAASTDEDGATAEPHTIDYPYEARQTLLDRLENDLYKDAMALDVEKIAAGAVTATQIKAAYEPLSEKADDLEFCVLDFVNGILELAEIPDENPTFTRSTIVNTTEIITNVIQAATYLGEDYTVEKLLDLLGDGDKVDSVMADRELESMTIMNAPSVEGEPTENGEVVDNGVVKEAQQATGKSLTVGQINSLIGIMQQYQDGALTENQTINIISIALGVSKEQARDLIS